MPSPEGYMPSFEEQTLSSKEKEERLYSGRIVSSIRAVSYTHLTLPTNREV